MGGAQDRLSDSPLTLNADHADADADANANADAVSDSAPRRANTQAIYPIDMPVFCIRNSS
ncbi:hypothetical protein EBAPG3_001925 [Nitrosospira lacus]|uniref:Uncharacterized protein n=1 Tax=Nitrosospira lacus TaxID=1288494 RepID=A0A1W6SLE7_9PROT|nr:hypothetical protein EBAPG3_001925 [Nitrosospira lacus]